jgi:hypothetical protein
MFSRLEITLMPLGHTTLQDCKPSPRAATLSVKGCFLTAEPSPRGSSRRRPLGVAQPVKALRQEPWVPLSVDVCREVPLALGEG